MRQDRADHVQRISACQDDAGLVRAVLRPRIVVRASADPVRAAAIRHEIGRVCFIARSVNFPVRYEPELSIEA